MLIGYARVSTEEQNLDSQRDTLKQAGCERILPITSAAPKPADRDLKRHSPTFELVTPLLSGAWIGWDGLFGTSLTP
jgi:hypothetical protein